MTSSWSLILQPRGSLCNEFPWLRKSHCLPYCLTFACDYSDCHMSPVKQQKYGLIEAEIKLRIRIGSTWLWRRRALPEATLPSNIIRHPLSKVTRHAVCLKRNVMALRVPLHTICFHKSLITFSSKRTLLCRMNFASNNIMCSSSCEVHDIFVGF